MVVCQLANCYLLLTTYSSLLTPRSSLLQRPQDIKSALLAAFAFPCLAIYLPTGLTVVGLWGADVPNPVTNAMANGPLSAVANAMLLYSTLMGFLVASTPVNGLAQACFFPTFDGGLHLRNLPKLLVITTPSLLVSSE